MWHGLTHSRTHARTLTRNFVGFDGLNNLFNNSTGAEVPKEDIKLKNKERAPVRARFHVASTKFSRRSHS